MRAAARSANLRAILAEDEDIRPIVLEMVDEMEVTAIEDIRGFRRASMLDHTLSSFIINSETTAFQLREHEYLLFCNLVAQILPDRAAALSTRGLSVEEISLRGVCYGTSSSSKYRNSTVLFQAQPQTGPHETSSLKAGIIQTIFQHMHDDSTKVPQSSPAFYVIVREHPCMIATDDPYRNFGFAGGFLCAEEATELHVIEISQIVSHFAMTKFKDQQFKHYFHVMPLDRVRCSFNFRS
jgi:hypothetical protein